MNSKEFSEEFDLLYNNIRSNGAPSIDLYEKSLFLTKAQEQIVFNYFSPEGNKYKEGFERSEKRRRDLEKLVKPYYTGNNPSKIEEESDTNKLFLDGIKSYFIEIPSNVFFILREIAILQSGERMRVLPITHDEMNLQSSNPFRKPKSDKISKRVWRADVDAGSFDDAVEIIVPDDKVVVDYHMRYVMKPNPIILTDISTGEFSGLGLSIDGKTSETLCELSEITQRQIIDRAVILAKAAYDQKDIEVQTASTYSNE